MKKIPQTELDICVEMYGSKEAVIKDAKYRTHSNMKEINYLELEIEKLQARCGILEISNRKLQNLIENLKS